MKQLSSLAVRWIGMVTIAALMPACDGSETSGGSNGAGGDDCGMSLCGCWTSTTMLFDAKIQDASMMPLEGIELLCFGEDTPIDISDVTGALSFAIQTEQSPGCGFARCNNLILHDPNGKYADIQGTYFSFNGQTVTVP